MLDLPAWKIDPNGPLLTLGARKEWDETSATWASVVRVSPSEWRMYYTGRNRGSWLHPSRERIGLAFSRDGLHWEKYDNNPVIDTGERSDWDSRYVYCPSVWQEGGLWKMVFTGCDYKYHFQIGLAESTDGIRWDKSDQNPVFCDHSLGRNRCGRPETEAWGIVKQGTRYMLLYNTVTIKPRQIYAAESVDLVRWKALSSDPMIPSEGKFDDLGYMKYCAWPYAGTGHEIFIFAATSNADYKRSAIGLWKATDFSQKPTFLGYVMRADDLHKKELDTPFLVKETMPGSQDSLCLIFGCRAEDGKWTEEAAFGMFGK